MKGWKYEGYRHSLAAKGVKTSLYSKRPEFKYVVKYMTKPYKSGNMIKREEEYAVDREDAEGWKKTLEENKDVWGIEIEKLEDKENFASKQLFKFGDRAIYADDEGQAWDLLFSPSKYAKRDSQALSGSLPRVFHRVSGDKEVSVYRESSGKYEVRISNAYDEDGPERVVGVFDTQEDAIDFIDGVLRL